MRKIIQQMLKGEQVAFCESVQTELKALAAKKEKALASLQELFAESEKKKFDEIVEGWDKASAVAFEDYYGAGFVFGVLAGLETSGVFDKKYSVLYRVLSGRLTRESVGVSSDRERVAQNIRDNEKMIERFRGEKEERFNDFYEFIGDIAALKEDEYLINGIRKGLLVGVCCADFLTEKASPV